MSLTTIPPGRTPGQVPVPMGEAAGTGISVHGTPPSVQLVEVDGSVTGLVIGLMIGLMVEPSVEPKSPACAGRAFSAAAATSAGRMFLAVIVAPFECAR